MEVVVVASRPAARRGLEAAVAAAVRALRLGTMLPIWVLQSLMPWAWAARRELLIPDQVPEMAGKVARLHLGAVRLPRCNMATAAAAGLVVRRLRRPAAAAALVFPVRAALDQRVHKALLAQTAVLLATVLERHKPIWAGAQAEIQIYRARAALPVARRLWAAAVGQVEAENQTQPRQHTAAAAQAANRAPRLLMAQPRHTTAVAPHLGLRALAAAAAVLTPRPQATAATAAIRVAAQAVEEVQ